MSRQRTTNTKKRRNSRDGKEEIEKRGRTNNPTSVY
jgi:hypothetical protein